MAETEIAAVKPKRGGWFRKLLWIAGGFVVLLVVAYFVLTSGAFFKVVILPKVGQALNATVTVSDASISPFSQVVLRDLKVQAAGMEPLVTAKEVRARYSLMAIIAGNIRVDEVLLDSPTVTVVKKADGTSNLDPILKATSQGKPAPPPPKSSAPSKPLNVDVKKIAINNATVRFTQIETNGGKLLTEIDGFNFGVDDVKNGQTARISLGSGFKYSSSAPAAPAELAASLKGNFQASLGVDLLPTLVKGNAELAIPIATGPFADAARLDAKLTSDLSLTDIKQLALNFTRDAKELGAITVSGPFDALKQEGKIKVDVTGIGNEVLSLVGGRYGIYFGSTKLAASYDIDLKNKAQFITTSGTLTGSQFSLTRSNLTTPVLDFNLGYGVVVDLPKTNATVRSFTFNVTQKGRPLLRAGITKEMLLDWSKGAQAIAESTLEMTVNELNLADWRALLGPNVSAGVVNGKLSLNVQKAGKQIAFDLSSQLAGLAAAFGPDKIDRTDVNLAVRGQVADFSQINLADFGFQVAHANQPVMSAKAGGQFNSTTQDADFQTEWNASLPQVAALLARPDLAISSGAVKFTGHVTQKNLTPNQTNNPNMDRSLAGNFALTDLTGRFSSNRFDRFETTADLDVAVKNQVAEIRKLAGALKQAGQPGGAWEGAGKYDLTNQVGQLTFKLTDLNQNTLRSFLAAALGERTLTSISISANVSGRYDAKGESGLKGDAQVANLLITDPKGQLPKVPMTAEAKMDLGLSPKGIAEVRQFTGNVRQGNQPGGSFDMTGTFDMTNQAGQLALKLTDLNQNTLRPFLAQALGDKTLASISINANSTARYDAKGESSVKADLQVTNLVIKDPAGKLPTNALAAGLQLNASLAKQLLDLRQAQLTLAPTDRAKNQMQLAGKVDMAQSNAITGNLKLTAESLDVTPYYDLFMGQKPASSTPAGQASAPAPTPAPTPGPPKPETEPAAINLPFQNFTSDASVGRFYLRELAITNFLTTVKIDDGRVVLDPFQLILNGAPVSAKTDLNLGVPGYQYDLSLTADKIPIEPLANSFSPEYAGQAKGDLLANLQVKGAGITGPSLQKNLTGGFGFTFTNAVIHLAGRKAKLFITPIALVLGQSDLTRAPLNWLTFQGKMGAGKITCDRISMVSEAYEADTGGDILLASVLTNSPINNWPVEFSLKRSLAEKANLVPANAPTNTPYVKLPTFVKETGTLGTPETKTDKLVLLGIVTKSVGGLEKIVGKDTGKTLGTLGSFLTGEKSATTNQTSTNQTSTTQSSTNKPAKVSPSDLLKKFLK